MSVSKTPGYGTSDNTHLQREIEKRNHQIHENNNLIGYIYGVQERNNLLLGQLAVARVLMEEEIKGIKCDNEKIAATLQQIKKQNRDETPSSDKICRVVTAIVIIGLIATGIVFGVIRYT
jgi:hypothetical protein